MKTLKQETVNEIIKLAEQEGSNRRAALRKYIDELSGEEQAELVALMSFGRNDAVDGPIPFEEHAEHARNLMDGGVGSYLAGKVPLAQYLRDGLKLLKDKP
jgi:hypothetical protein